MYNYSKSTLARVRNTNSNSTNISCAVINVPLATIVVTRYTLPLCANRGKSTMPIVKKKLENKTELVELETMEKGRATTVYSR